MGNYLIKRFIPSFIIVSSSFIGFWIPTAISPARSTLSVTALLAMITQQIQSDLNVSYVYALQVWNIVCIIFVFANLAEFALAMYVMHAVQKRVNRQMSIDPKFTEMGLANGGAPRPEVSTVWQHHWRRIKHRLRMQFRTNTQHSSVDIIARYLIPPAYFAFVIVFALYCIAQWTFPPIDHNGDRFTQVDSHICLIYADISSLFSPNLNSKVFGQIRKFKRH